MENDKTLLTDKNEHTDALNATDKVLDYLQIIKDLATDGLVSRETLDDLIVAEREYKSSNMHPLSFLGTRKLPDRRRAGKHLTVHALAGWLARKFGIVYLRIDPLRINVAEVTKVMSFAFAQRHGILAVSVEPDEVVIACAEPNVLDWQNNLQQTLRKKIRRVLSDAEDIKRYSVEFYSLARSIDSAKHGDVLRPSVGNLEAMLELGALKDPDANDQHIVNIVDWLLQYAYGQRASDIHIEPRRKTGLVRFRIDGVLHPIHELPMQIVLPVISRIKTMGRMNVAEKRRPQDGRLKTVLPDGEETELRLSTLPTAFGEKLVMRIFDPGVLFRSFDELGLDGRDYEMWKEMISRRDGIVLVTGPTGSGKTTSLYSSLKMLATPEVNVCTIEDPIEMIEDSFNQMQVNKQIELNFASGVRSLLRQDPDIIMIGEIRDLETAEMAVQAALTGHLVLATLHTGDAASAITRLLELGIPPYLINATVIGVMAQRLVRTLCAHCKKHTHIEEEVWQELLRPWKMKMPEKPFKERGCLECRNTGYLGRQGIYELMAMSKGLRGLVNHGADLDSLRRQALKEGMQTLRVSGAKKIAAGNTTISEVMRVAPDINL